MSYPGTSDPLIQLTEKEAMAVLEITDNNLWKQYLEAVGEKRCPGTYGRYILEKVTVLQAYLHLGYSLEDFIKCYTANNFSGTCKILYSHGMDIDREIERVTHKASDIFLAKPIPSSNRSWLNILIIMTVALLVVVGSWHIRNRPSDSDNDPQHQQ